jgi:hypothetical protein
MEIITGYTRISKYGDGGLGSYQVHIQATIAFYLAASGKLSFRVAKLFDICFRGSWTRLLRVGFWLGL